MARLPNLSLLAKARRSQRLHYWYDELRDQRVDIMECVRCGATAVVEGSLMDMGGGGGVAFLASDKSFLRRIFGSGSRKIMAHACVHCSHLELTVEFTEKDRTRYQEFDGPQPSVLDRIS